MKLKSIKRNDRYQLTHIGWVLINKLADKLNLKPVEVYREHIKNLNVCKQMTLPRNEFKTLSHAWGMLGLGWVVEQLDITDKDEIIANFYYGSSTYNTSQMSKLINNIVEDCKLQGIPTLEDLEIKRMCEKWQ